MKLHREGNLILIIAFLLLGGVVAGAYALTWDSNLMWIAHLLLAGAIVFYALIVNFFRNPVFEIVSDELTVIAPANGKLVVIEEIDEQVYFKDKRLQLSIFMSPLDVHVNRMPVAGKIKWLKYFPGKYLVAWHPKSSTDNEQTYLVIENDLAQVGVKQIAGAVARRIRWYVAENDSLNQGEEFGFIRFGSRVDVILPTNAEVVANLNDMVKGGRTVLARLQPNHND